MSDQQIWELLQSLSLEEKAALCSGADAWITKPNSSKGIPSLRMADGPHGVRLEAKQKKSTQNAHSLPATCFPPEVTLAASWMPALTRRVGEAIAEECLHYKIGMILGPGVNIKRSPLGGRNFEYYSEDPLLSGELAAGFIQGAQSRGVATSLKHYAVNSQEHKRMSISAAVDDRALFDIYLKSFEIAIKKSQPATVMCSYNRVNGVYSSENRRLLTDILRLRFGFTGVVVSDWGAVNSRPDAIMAGLDLEMPSSGGANDYAIVQAVQAGTLPMDSLDTACWNLLKLVFTYAKAEPPHHFVCDFDVHHGLAVEALVKSAVLLKNEGMLPLSRTDSIAVIGEMAAKPRYQGGGSSIINPKNLVSLLDAMDAAEHPYTYCKGYTTSKHNSDLVKQAVSVATDAEKVLLFLGLPDAYECEGYDRQHLQLPAAQIELLEAITGVNANVCVVLSCGSPVETPWLSKIQALLCPHLGGEGVGEALLQLLYGATNPSGKLAESWPVSLADTPCYHHFPMGPTEVTYNESIFVGYRYYDTAQKAVQFPFGFGLSYTRFAYSNLALAHTTLGRGQALEFSFKLENIGSWAGEEIVQVYIAHKNSHTWQPAHELKTFARISLAAGESSSVTLKLLYTDLNFYDATTGTHVVEGGEYEIQIGSDSRNLPLTSIFLAEGATLSHAPTLAPAFPCIPRNGFADEDFSLLYPEKLQGNTPPQKGDYTLTTTLGEMSGSFWGRLLLRLATLVSQKNIRFSMEPSANKMAGSAMAKDLPLKNVVLQTGGVVSPEAALVLLDMCNGRGGFFRLVPAVLRRKPYRK